MDLNSKLELEQTWIIKHKASFKPYRQHLKGRREALVTAIIASDEPCLILKGRVRMLEEQIQALT